MGSRGPTIKYQSQTFALTDSGRLFTHKHINYSGPAETGFQNNHSARLGLHFADDASIPSVRTLPQTGDDRVGYLGGDDREQLSFVGHVKRIKP